VSHWFSSFLSRYQRPLCKNKSVIVDGSNPEFGLLQCFAIYRYLVPQNRQASPVSITSADLISASAGGLGSSFDRPSARAIFVIIRSILPDAGDSYRTPAPVKLFVVLGKPGSQPLQVTVTELLWPLSHIINVVKDADPLALSTRLACMTFASLVSARVVPK
jgi:hypothetical protein